MTWNGLPPDATVTGWHKVQTLAANPVQTMWNAQRKVWVFGNPKSHRSRKVDPDWMATNKFAYLGACDEPIFPTRAINNVATKLIPKTVIGSSIGVGTIMKDGNVVSSVEPYKGDHKELFGRARNATFLKGGGQIIPDDDFLEIWVTA